MIPGLTKYIFDLQLGKTGSKNELTFNNILQYIAKNERDNIITYWNCWKNQNVLQQTNETRNMRALTLNLSSDDI